MSMLRRALLAAGATLLAVVAVTGCSNPPPPTLVPGLRDNPPNPAKGISRGSFLMRANTFSIQMASFLCSVHDVHLTAARLYRPSDGIKLRQWGIENNHITTNGETVGPLSRLGPYTSHDISRRCHHAQWYSRVGLELHRTRPGTQSFLGLRITYNSDGRQKIAYLWEQYHFRDPHKPES